MKKKMELLMDEKRNLFLRGENGQEYKFWPMGWGIPVSFMVETEAEAALKDAQEKQARAEESERWRLREAEEKARPWWKKLTT